MNRYHPAVSAEESFAPIFQNLEEEGGVAVMTAPARPAVALITRRIKPGTSIRRLRHHRCAWPRRD